MLFYPSFNNCLLAWNKWSANGVLSSLRSFLISLIVLWLWSVCLQVKRVFLKLPLLTLGLSVKWHGLACSSKGLRAFCRVMWSAVLCSWSASSQGIRQKNMCKMGMMMRQRAPLRRSFEVCDRSLIFNFLFLASRQYFIRRKSLGGHRSAWLRWSGSV